jgi:hypothetical protein
MWLLFTLYFPLVVHSQLPCSTKLEVGVTVGGVTTSVSPTVELLDNEEQRRQCSVVKSGWEGAIDLKCTNGNLGVTVRGKVANCKNNYVVMG